MKKHCTKCVKKPFVSGKKVYNFNITGNKKREKGVSGPFAHIGGALCEKCQIKNFGV